MARYYDSNVGRLITKDTFTGFKRDPLSINQYTDTENNPIMFVDPNGNYVVNDGPGWDYVKTIYGDTRARDGLIAAIAGVIVNELPAGVILKKLKALVNVLFYI